MASPAVSARGWEHLNHWALDRKLEKLAKKYALDAKIQPDDSLFTSKVHPQYCYVTYLVDRLKKYREEMEGVYEEEIQAGRVRDSRELWAHIYREKIFDAIFANINSLRSHLRGILGSTNHERSWVIATEEPLREIDRVENDLRKLERKLPQLNELVERQDWSPAPEPADRALVIPEGLLRLNEQQGSEIRYSMRHLHAPVMDHQQEAAPPSRQGGKAARKRRISKPQQLKNALMLVALRKDRSGREYCQDVDEAKAPPPPEWFAKPGVWPGSYVKAYDAPQDQVSWRQLIADEKNRYSEKLADRLAPTR